MTKTLLSNKVAILNTVKQIIFYIFLKRIYKLNVRTGYNNYK